MHGVWDVEQSAVVIAYRTRPAMEETKENTEFGILLSHVCFNC